MFKKLNAKEGNDLSLYKKLFNQQKQAKMREVFLQLAQKGRILKIDKAEQIVLSEKQSFAIVCSGQIKQSLFSQDGSEKSLYLLRAGEIFGEMDYFTESENKLINTAMKKSSIALISRNELEKRLKKEADLYRYFIHSISRKFRIVMLQMAGMVFNDSAGKLAEILIRLAAQEGIETEAGINLDLNLTHQDLADLIGCSRSTVSRELNNFKQHGLIKIVKKQIIIKDLKALKKYINQISK